MNELLLDMNIETIVNILLIAVIALVVLSIVLLVMVIVSLNKVKKQKQRYDRFMEKAVDASSGTLDSLIDGIINQVDELHMKNSELQKKQNSLRQDMKYCGQKISMIRYNAFSDVGSDQSYSIAMLDENDDGFVLTGIYARESSSTYAKPIIAGESKYQLSKEEKEVINSAKEEYNKRIINKEN